MASGQQTDLTFTNAYSAEGYAQIDAKKLFNGGELKTGEFSFRLLDEEGNLVSTASNNTDGSVYFDEIRYTEPGTYRYTIEEIPGDDGRITYDSSKKDVEVVVTDNGNGTLSAKVEGVENSRTFTNTVKTGSAKLTKVADGAGPDTEFSFRISLADSDGNALSGSYSGTIGDRTVQVKDGDTVRLKAGETLTVGGLPDGAVFGAKETDIPDGYRLADGTVESVKVEADKTAEMIVTNLYSAKGEYRPEAVKKMTGAELSIYDPFTFEMYDEAGVLVQRVESDSEGKISFDPLLYTDADVGKTFTYTIREVNDGQTGVEYDTKVRKLEVTITDNGDGTLKADGRWEDGNVFENKVIRYELPKAGLAAGVSMAAVAGCAVLVSGILMRPKKKDEEDS